MPGRKEKADKKTRLKQLLQTGICFSGLPQTGIMLFRAPGHLSEGPGSWQGEIRRGKENRPGPQPFSTSSKEGMEMAAPGRDTAMEEALAARAITICRGSPRSMPAVK